MAARLDRIDMWSLPYLFIGITGVGFLFIFYDIFDVNVSFIQTCTQISPGCTPETALGALGFPVLLNLIGYVVGKLALSPLSDRIGRRNMLLITPFLPHLSVLGAFLLTGGFLCVAAIIAQFGIHTRGRRLDEISP